MKHVYQYHNLITKHYSDLIFRFEDFETYSRMLNDLILLKPNFAKEQEFDLCELVYVGTYDEEFGKLTYSEEIKTFDMRSAFAQYETLRSQVNVAS